MATPVVLFQAHPWHGVSPGERCPEEVNAYIEIVPTDPVKYELDKVTGHLRLDRPQRFSSLCPTLYGFIPRTYCADAVAERCREKTGLAEVEGDKDPLDICVLTEKPIVHGNFFLQCTPVGGLRMVDSGQADDKIVAVLVGDLTYGKIGGIHELPKGIVDRLRHYFLTYKQIPYEKSRQVEIHEVYGREEALEVIRRSQRDYHAAFGA
jgi:inorganic pyrophosphatase